MTEFLSAFELFRFIRPLWLIALPAIALIWWVTRSKSGTLPGWTAQIPRHLLDHLLLNQSNRTRVRAIDLVGCMLVLVALAAAGPTWQRISNPLFSENAPLVVVFEVSETMLANDVAPTRLERARLKILDLVSLRSGARTAVVAYAGSAHLVLPPTDDPRIVKMFVEGLDPSVMPEKGQKAGKAIALAHEVLSKETTPGTILFVNDGIDPSDVAAFRDYARTEKALPVAALVLGTDKGGRIRTDRGSFGRGSGGSMASTAVSPALLDRWGAEGRVDIVRFTADKADTRRVERLLQSNFRSAVDTDENSQWKDQGWWLILPALLLGLVWFGRGWSMQWIWILVVAGTFSGVPDARADGLADWFFTPDQQGRFAYDNNRLEPASTRFEDPMWKGIALYKRGKYLEAAETFSRVPSPDGLFNMGNAFVKGRDYDRAIEAYEQALKEAPGHRTARHNLTVTRTIVAYLTKLRTEEDTGGQPDLGADGYKFDKKAGEGNEAVFSGQEKLKLESAEQWMRTVQTQMRDFLRTKFALEAAQDGGQ